MDAQDVPCLAIADADALMKEQEINSWLDDVDVSNLLGMDESPLLDLQSVPTSSPEYYFESVSSPESPPSFSSPYSSPEMSELESSFISTDSPLFGDHIDATLFGPSFSVNPEVIPELEKILATVEYISSESAPSSPSQNNGASRPAKKRKSESGKVADTDILLPREQLLVMTSTEIESYVSNLKSKRNLTAAEEKELKRQRRLVKNREYASQSRSRKKQFVDELEKTIEDLRAENSALKNQVNSLSDENRTLKKRMSDIATTIKRSSGLSSSSSGVLTKLTTVGRPSNNKTVGACLFAIMFMVFTVGLLGNNEAKFQIFPSENTFTYRGGRVLLAVELKPDQLELVYDASMDELKARARHYSNIDTVPDTVKPELYADATVPTASTTSAPVTTTTTATLAAPLLQNSTDSDAVAAMPKSLNVDMGTLQIDLCKPNSKSVRWVTFSFSNGVATTTSNITAMEFS